MAGSPQAIVKPLCEDYIRKALQKWPKRQLLRTVFAHPEFMKETLSVNFGDFIILNDVLITRIFPLNQTQDKASLFLHPELLHNFSDEIPEVISCLKPKSVLESCRQLQLKPVGHEEKADEIIEFIKCQLMDFPVIENGFIFFNYYGKSLKFKVESCHINQDICGDLQNMSLSKTSTPVRQTKSLSVQIVTEETEIWFEKLSKEISKRKVFFGGGENEMQVALQAIENQKPYSGILIYGPSGCGKSLMAEAISQKLVNFKTTHINGVDVFSKFAGETEQQLRNRFNHATKESKKNIIIMDEIESLISTDSKSEQDRRVSASLKSIIDDLSEEEYQDDEKTVLIAISNSPDTIDPSFRRPGRLELEIEMPVPNFQERISILKALLEKAKFSLDEDFIHFLCQNAHGYVGADLEAVISHLSVQNNLDQEQVAKALKMVRPSAMREVQVNVPNVTWEDIGGLEDLKLKLRQAVEWPIKKPEVFKRMGITPPKGVLMYGPPGCSKTMIAKALANESHLNFVAIKGPELFKKYVGESEQVIFHPFCYILKHLIALGSNLVEQFCRWRCLTAFPVRSNNKYVCYFTGRGIL